MMKIKEMLLKNRISKVRRQSIESVPIVFPRYAILISFAFLWINFACAYADENVLPIIDEPEMFPTVEQEIPLKPVKLSNEDINGLFWLEGVQFFWLNDDELLINLDNFNDDEDGYPSSILHWDTRTNALTEKMKGWVGCLNPEDQYIRIGTATRTEIRRNWTAEKLLKGYWGKDLESAAADYDYSDETYVDHYTCKTEQRGKAKGALLKKADGYLLGGSQDWGKGTKTMNMFSATGEKITEFEILDGDIFSYITEYLPFMHAYFLSSQVMTEKRRNTRLLWADGRVELVTVPESLLQWVFREPYTKHAWIRPRYALPGPIWAVTGWVKKNIFDVKYDPRGGSYLQRDGKLYRLPMRVEKTSPNGCKVVGIQPVIKGFVMQRVVARKIVVTNVCTGEQ